MTENIKQLCIQGRENGDACAGDSGDLRIKK